MVCFLALECGYWQVSQIENWVSSVCLMSPQDGFSGDLLLKSRENQVCQENLTGQLNENCYFAQAGTCYR